MSNVQSTCIAQHLEAYLCFVQADEVERLEVGFHLKRLRAKQSIFQLAFQPTASTCAERSSNVFQPHDKRGSSEMLAPSLGSHAGGLCRLHRPV